MSVVFNQIPPNLRVPFFFAEINPGSAPYQTISRLLLIGQMTAAGSATPNMPVLVTGGEGGLFGVGSQLAAMYAIARLNAPFQEIWAVPLADAGGAVKATSTITYAKQAPLTTPGSIVLYIGGLRVSVPVNTALTNTQIANALVAAINTCPDMQVTAANVAGVAASVSFTVTLSAIGVNTIIPLIINGVTYSVPVLGTDTASMIAGKLAAAVDPTSGCSASVLGAAVTVTALSTGVWANTVTASTWTAAVNTPVLSTLTSGTNDVTTLTANNAGTLGNGIRVETRLLNDDPHLADQILTLTQFSNGVGDPNIATALINLGDDLWDFIVMPYCQSYFLDQIEAWLQNRWSPNSQTYGLNFTAMVGNTAGGVIAFTSTRNSPFTNILPMNKSPQPAYLLAAAFGAVGAVNLQDAPNLSLPLQTIHLQGILPPKAIGDRWSIVQRQSFYYAGAGGYIVAKDGTVMLDRVVTTYQLDQWGNPDQSWLDVNTLAQLVYGVRYIRSYITETYPRCALVDSNPGNLQSFVTVRDLQNAIIHAYIGLCTLGVFQDANTFASMVIVERNSQDPNRVDVYLPTDAVNALRVFATNVTSFVQFPASS